jgi:uncharacterized coiled-coil DUF342 family protein
MANIKEIKEELQKRHNACKDGDRLHLDALELITEIQAENERLKEREEEWKSLLQQAREIIKGWKKLYQDYKDFKSGDSHD